jgi:hypothetical protein
MPRPYISSSSNFVKSNAITSTMILQQNHGFSVGSLVYFNRWWKLASNTSEKLPIGIVSEVQSAHRFKYTVSGLVTIPTHGFAVGSKLFCDASGALTITNANTNILVGVASDGNTLLVSFNQVYGLDKLFTNAQAKGDLVKGGSNNGSNNGNDNGNDNGTSLSAPAILKASPTDGYMLSVQSTLGNADLVWNRPTHNREPLAEVSATQFDGTDELIIDLAEPLSEMAAIINVFEEQPSNMAIIDTWGTTSSNAEYAVEDFNTTAFNVTLDSVDVGSAIATKSAGTWAASDERGLILENVTGGGEAIITGANGAAGITVEVVKQFTSTTLTAPEIRYVRFAPHIQLSGTGPYSTQGAVSMTNNIYIGQWTALLDFTPTYTAAGVSLLHFTIGLVQVTTDYEYWYSVASSSTLDTPRIILRKQASGNYEYNDHATFSSSNFVVATSPTDLLASLREAFGIANNRSTGTQISNIIANLMPSITGMDRMRVAVFMETSGADTPTLSKIDVTYNANIVWQKTTSREVEIMDLSTIKVRANGEASRNIKVVVSR